MLEREEQKRVISYSDLENKMKVTEKFGLMYFELHHPENRKNIADLLNSSLRLGKLDSKETGMTNQLLGYLQELKNLTLKNEISLPDVYDQIYNQLLTEDHLRKINEEANNAFTTRKISLSERYLLSDTLLNLTKCQSKVKQYSGIEAKEEVKNTNLSEKILFVETVQHFAETANVADYLKQALSTGFTEKTKEWQEYNDICEKLTADSGLSSQVKDALTRLKKDDEAILPKNEWHDLSIAYTEMNKRDFKGLIEFVNDNYSTLPDNVTKQITEDILIDKLDKFGNEKINLNMNLVPAAPIMADDKTAYAYPAIKDEVARFLNSYKKKDFMQSEFSDLWSYTYSLVANNQASKNQYLLAFLQYAITELYSAQYHVDLGILWMNDRITDILLDKEMKPQAQRYLVKVAVSVLLDITKHDKRFGDVDLLVKKITPFENRHPFPATLHDQFDKNFRDKVYEEENTIKYSGVSEKRAQLLQDLNHKEVQYMAALERKIPTVLGYFDRDIRLVEILIDRLAGQEYQRERILSGDALSAKSVREELGMFKRVFETRTFRESHSSKVTSQLELQKVDVSNAGLFKQESHEFKQDETKQINSIKKLAS